MKRKNPLNTPNLKIQAVQATINRLKKDPEITAIFIKDALDGKAKDWNQYEQSYSEVLTKELLGRPEPKRNKGRCSVNTREMSKLAYQHDRMKEGMEVSPFSELIPLHKCKTPKERVKMILASNATPEIKADLLSAVF